MRTLLLNLIQRASAIALGLGIVAAVTLAGCQRSVERTVNPEELGVQKISQCQASPFDRSTRNSDLSISLDEVGVAPGKVAKLSVMSVKTIRGSCTSQLAWLNYPVAYLKSGRGINLETGEDNIAYPERRTSQKPVHAGTLPKDCNQLYSDEVEVNKDLSRIFLACENSGRYEVWTWLANSETPQSTQLLTSKLPITSIYSIPHQHFQEGSLFSIVQQTSSDTARVVSLYRHD